MKVWITKYALTKGIKISDDARVCGETSDNMIEVKENGYGGYYHKPYWHTSEEDAKEQVKVMIKAKLKSLKKQMAKMEAMAEEYGLYR